METLTKWIAVPLGYIMEWCCGITGNYGLAIILFTLLTKIILLPLSVWVQKNSIKMVKMQPELNRIKAKFYGDGDTIADEQSKLYKQYKYNPLASLVPLAMQLLLLMGVVGVIYNPFDCLFHLPAELIAELNRLASGLTETPLDSSGIQLTAIEAIKNPAYFEQFAALRGSFTGIDIDAVLESIRSFDLNFLGINLSYTPSVMLGITIAVPIVAGLSSYLLCVAQNRSNVLQAEQSKFSQISMLLLSVGLSLYLGFFVPAGIALYWVASNLFAIVQLYALNAVIPPKKYVDYEALEASRQELAALDALGEKKKLFSTDENSRREKFDYKRFFSVSNKHIVFYSEKSGFYKYYAEIIEYLLKKTNVVIHYVTNDPNDVIFEKAKENSQIRAYYIGVKKLITLMMKMDADIVVMTTPDLDNYYIKRSLVRKDIEYVFVPHDPSSMHMGFREHALDNFDTVFCTGPHIAAEVRASEKLYKTKEKTLVEFGYPLIEKLTDSCEKLGTPERVRPQVLIAPSWQEDNLLDSVVEQLIDSLYGEYKIIVRPHPEYMKRYSYKMDELVEKYKDKLGENLSFELDFSSSESVYSSDVLITDWSGIGIEFGFATLKPVLFVNTKIKMENPNYEKIGIVPQEIRLRDVLGVSIEKSEAGNAAAEVRKLLASPDSFRERIRGKRSAYFYNFGSDGTVGAKYLIGRMVKGKK